MTEPQVGPIETILEVGAEGGSITLRGRRKSNGAWQFQVATDETALWEMFDEEPPASAAGSWIHSWDGAMTDLGRYPWPQLHPLVVHRDFADAILAAVSAYEGIDAEKVNQWRDIISSSR